MKRPAAITAAFAFLFVASANAQMPTPLDVQQALGLVRQLNTVQAVIAFNTKSYGSQADMLTGERGLSPFLKTHSADKNPMEWEKYVNFSSSEILPGWTLDFAKVAKGYRLILAGEDSVLITDETGIIYRAVRVQPVPKAAKLKSAKDFPGAVPHDQFRESRKG